MAGDELWFVFTLGAVAAILLMALAWWLCGSEWALRHRTRRTAAREAEIRKVAGWEIYRFLNEATNEAREHCAKMAVGEDSYLLSGHAGDANHFIRAVKWAIEAQAAGDTMTHPKEAADDS